MMTSWFGMEQVMLRIERRDLLGIIGIDLSEWRNGFLSGIDEDDFSWSSWLTLAMGRSDLWYGDELGNHLWLYAEIPDNLREDESEAYLRAMAKRVREAIVAHTGAAVKAISQLPRHRERGIGYAQLKGWNTLSARDVIYEGMLQATTQMHTSLVEQSDWELRFELDRLLTDSSIRSVYQPIMRLGDGRVFGY
jgi:hypothetical protein